MQKRPDTAPSLILSLMTVADVTSVPDVGIRKKGGKDVLLADMLEVAMGFSSLAFLLAAAGLRAAAFWAADAAQREARELGAATAVLLLSSPLSSWDTPSSLLSAFFFAGAFLAAPRRRRRRGRGSETRINHFRIAAVLCSG